MADKMDDDEREPGEPRMWYLRMAVIAQAATKRPLAVFLVFGLLGAAAGQGVDPPWLGFVTGFMVGWWVLWASRRMVARAKAYIALEAVPKPEKVRTR